MRLEIECGGYEQAAVEFGAANRAAALGYDALAQVLAGGAGMAGDDGTATDFAAAYDAGAQEAVEAFADVVGSLARLSELTDASVANHRAANQGSARGLRRLGGAAEGPLRVVYDADEPLPDRALLSVEPTVVPSSLGGDVAALPAGVNWVLDQVEGFVWPNADVGRLREAAAAWAAAAGDLDRLDFHHGNALLGLRGQRSAELPAAERAVRAHRRLVADLAGDLRSLGQACEDWAADVEAKRQEVVDFAVGLLAEAAVCQGIGVVLGAVTGGATAAGAAALNAARIAAASPRLLAILSSLRLLAGATATRLRTVRTSLEGLRGRLLRYKSANTVRATPARAGAQGGKAGGETATTALTARLPGGGLRAHEAAGGHTLSRHVGKSDDELLARFLTEPRRDFSSAFTDEQAAERALAKLLDSRSSEVEEWLRGGGRKFVLEGDSGEVIGRTAVRETGSVVDASRVRAVMLRDAAMPIGWRLLTAFPSL